MSLPRTILPAIGFGLFLAGAGCDSWYGYRIAGSVTREGGVAAGGIVVVPSIVPYKLIGPPRFEGAVATATRVYSSKDVAPVLATVTSADGRYEDRALGEFVESAFSPPASPLENVFVYVWQDGWIEHRVALHALPQPLLNRWTRFVQVPPIRIGQPPSQTQSSRPSGEQP